MFDEEFINCFVKVFLTIQMPDENELARNSEHEDQKERNNQRFCILLFNCLYKGCDVENSWFVVRKKNSIDDHESSYLVKPKCCELFKNGLWVNHNDLEIQNMRGLIDKFENKVLNENLNINNSAIIEINETEELCDRILNELFIDSNSIRPEYEDFAWYMRHYDKDLTFYMRYLDSNPHVMENQFTIE
jgi:hypothetical protein